MLFTSVKLHKKLDCGRITAVIALPPPFLYTLYNGSF